MSAAATSPHTVEGMVVPFNRWQEVNNSREGHFLERFAVGSLSKSFGLLRRVKGYFDHGRTASFDRMPVFSVEEAWEEPTGAYFRGSLLDGIPTFVIDGIRKGLYGASLGAEPIDVDVDPFPKRSAHNPRRLEERTYREVRAFDISLTAAPAYEEAVVALRAIDSDDEPGTIRRAAFQPVRFRSAVPDYLAGEEDPPPDYLSEERWWL